MSSIDTFGLIARSQPIWYVAFIFIIGLMIGSFLNVVIYRTPKMLERNFRHECACMDDPDALPPPVFNLAKPDSTCPNCGAAIRGYDNIPVISWLILRGKCRNCQNPISARYPLIELSTAILSAWIAARFGWSQQALGALTFTWALIALFWIDADTYLLPDSITLPLVWAGLLFNLGNTYTSLSASVIGAVAGYISLWSVYWAHRLATGREGMGYGDFKLLAAIGAWLGWQLLPQVILISSVAGAVIGITMTIGAKRGWGTPLPFGPYLAIAAFIAMMWRTPLQQLLAG